MTSRIGHYLKIYEKARFTDWENFSALANNLERIVKGRFDIDIPIMKLIGSSVTKTMRKGHEDLDYAVAFKNPPNNKDFLKKIENLGLNITKIKQNKNYGYLKVSGKYGGRDFVLVPMTHPNGKVKTYEQDAFYHSDFINQRKDSEHSFNTILAKEFFSQIGVYKEIKGIGSELLILFYKNFENMINAFADHNSIRINYSKNDAVYSKSLLVVDYPFLGGRSFTKGVTNEIYELIKYSSREIIESPTFLIGAKNGK